MLIETANLQIKCNTCITFCLSMHCIFDSQIILKLIKSVQAYYHHIKCNGGIATGTHINRNILKRCADHRSQSLLYVQKNDIKQESINTM